MGKMKKTGHAFDFPKCSLLQVFHFFGMLGFFVNSKIGLEKPKRDDGSLVQPILRTLGYRNKGPVFKPLTQWYAGETPACPLCQ
jgi:hypothetical protein